MKNSSKNCLRSKPELLDSLDLSVDESLADDTSYWVKSSDLKEIEALVYVSPEGISRRISNLEKNLTAENRLKLTPIAYDKFSDLEKTDGVKLGVWDISFRNHAFRQAVNFAVTQTQNEELQQKLTWLYQNEVYIDKFPAYRTARSRYFAGNFESERNAISMNAIQSFNALMYSDDTINGLGKDEFLQRRLGIVQDTTTPVIEFQRNLQVIQGQMRLVRRDAGFFLALAHFDNGNSPTAANWLLTTKKDVETASAKRWSDGINYLLGRSFESRNEYDRAIEMYREDKESVQVHGNLIRARMLSDLVERLNQS